MVIVAWIIANLSVFFAIAFMAVVGAAIVDEGVSVRVFDAGFGAIILGGVALPGLALYLGGLLAIHTRLSARWFRAVAVVSSPVIGVAGWAGLSEFLSFPQAIFALVVIPIACGVAVRRPWW